LLETPEDSRVKLYLTWKTLCLRRQQPSLFREGEYLPLAVAGTKANHIVAFARKSGGTALLVIAPRLVAGLLNNTDLPPIGPRIWEDTRVVLPAGDCRTKYRNILTGRVLDSTAEISVSEALAEFPAALCLLG
jgi:(1->4)-alpha-D-glucan 1-alpha-D-glucosylmutase